MDIFFFKLGASLTSFSSIKKKEGGEREKKKKTEVLKG